MPDDRGTDELASFLVQRGDHLMRSAVLLAGGRQAGEDLLQTAVERLLVRWRRFDGDPERYLRKVMANLATDDHRRRRLRYLVGCGELAVAGTGRIDGTKVIKVVQVGATLTPGLWETIWVKQGSYVPVRVAGGNGQFSWRADISWLRPAKANLALLTVPVPAGFRRTSLSDFPNAIIPVTVVICRPEPSNPNVRICDTPR